MSTVQPLNALNLSLSASRSALELEQNCIQPLTDDLQKYNQEQLDIRLKQIAKSNPAINLFLQLAVIPTPTVRPGHEKENEMKQNMEEGMTLYAQAFKELGVSEKNIERDKYGSLIICVPGAPGYENKQPLMFMGHMDIVPADLKDPLHLIHPRLIMHQTQKGFKEYIASDGTTTLGVDDKALLAIIWNLVKLLKERNIPHPPFEVVVVTDEETECTSITNLDTSRLNSKYIIDLDDNKAFQITFSCAGFVNIKIEVDGLQGGHSGSNDQSTISAADILKELHEKIGNRVIKYFPDFKDIPLISKNIYEYEIDRSASNKIPTKGHIYLSLRSNIQSLENEEIKRIEDEVKRIEKKYKSIEKELEIKTDIHKENPPYNGNPNSYIATALIKAANEIGQKEVKVTPEHGASQINNLAGKKNRYGEEFISVVIGVESEGWHSTKEKVDWESIIEVSNWLVKLVENYTKGEVP